MKTVQFKTNIKCDGCVATVTPFLNKAVGSDHWKVDMLTPDKVLTVELEEDKTGGDVVTAMKEAGYKAEEI